MKKSKFSVTFHSLDYLPGNSSTSTHNNFSETCDKENKKHLLLVYQVMFLFAKLKRSSDNFLELPSGTIF